MIITSGPRRHPHKISFGCCLEQERIKTHRVGTNPVSSLTCTTLTMFFTPLRSVLVVAQLLVAVLAVPAPLLDSVCSRSLTLSFCGLSPIKAIDARSLEARAPIIKFHVCTNINYRADCYYLATEPLTVPLSNSGCVNFKAEVASNIESVRVLDTWNYAVSLYE